MSDLKKQDMTNGQLRDYNAVKVVADGVGQVPIFGEIPLIMAKALCQPLHYDGLNRLFPATCQAAKDALGELDAPAFPKQQTVDRGPQVPTK